MQNSILVIDDEMDFLESVRRGLTNSGFRKLRLENDPEQAAALLERGETFDLALIDINMPVLDGILLLERIRYFSPNTECIMVTAFNDIKMAVECLKKGAYDYLVKPVSREDLISAIKRALERKRLLEILDTVKGKTLPDLANKEAFAAIITGSPKILKTLKEAELHAGSDVPILITGESGTGKELLARAIHLASSRSKYPFTPINMASLSGSLFDAEFFGYNRGSFTGAERNHTGFLESTNKGTLFLDEIGDLPPDFQGKLLRVLQEGEFIKLGTNSPQKADVRCIAATNKDLDQMIAKGIFRRDFYYRVKVALIHLIPLRERKEDIPLLVRKFLEELCDNSGIPAVKEDAMFSLLEYDYPGNIRELRLALQSALNLAQGMDISANFLLKKFPQAQIDLAKGFLKRGR